MTKNSSDSEKKFKADLNLSIEAAQAIRDYHHKSLWEEQKHFTWWISIILTAQIFLFLEVSISPLIKLFLTQIASIVGTFLCLMAIITIRREGEYFHNALRDFVRLYNLVNAENPLGKVGDKANKSIKELLKSLIKCKLGIRDVFQLIFIFFIAIYMILAGFSIFVHFANDNPSIPLSPGFHLIN